MASGEWSVVGGEWSVVGGEYEWRCALLKVDAMKRFAGGELDRVGHGGCGGFALVDAPVRDQVLVQLAVRERVGGGERLDLGGR